MGLAPTKRGRSSPPADRSPPPGLAVRRTATKVLSQIIENGVPLDTLLDDEHGDPHFLALDRRDRTFAHAIVATALRRRGETEAVLRGILDRPLAENTGTLSALLHIAAAQILYLGVPDHAAVDLAVTQAGSDRRTGRARGLVNGVLRRLIRDRDKLTARPGAARLNMPEWLFSRLVDAYGEATADAIAAAHLVQPGLDISVKSDAQGWAERLGGVLLPTGTVRLAETKRVRELDGYDEGAWWIQDAAAALPARLLGNVAGKSVADLCAAPGGKTAELAAAGADVTALDNSESRVRRLTANLGRLKLDAKIERADLFEWRPGRTFDAVLLDAPCSATGTIRRHPDIPWLKGADDVAALAKLQAGMLDRAADVVADGGLLVFCTCSLDPQEGESQVAPFLARHPEFALLPIESSELFGLSELIDARGALRTLPFHGFGKSPEMQGMDGFFTARFRRS